MDFRRKKITKISRTQVHILWGGVPPKKIFSAEILGPNIESAVHSTKPEDEFRLGKGLNTKFRREFFSAEVRYTICVVAFRWKPNYTKVRKNCLQSIRGHKISIFRRFFFSRSHAHNRPQKKRPQSPQRFVWQKNLRLQCKVLNPRPYPTLWPWVAHVIGRNLPG